MLGILELINFYYYKMNKPIYDLYYWILYVVVKVEVEVVVVFVEVIVNFSCNNNYEYILCLFINYLHAFSIVIKMI